MLVSSVKVIGVESLFIVLGKSFIYKRNNKGPNIDPCGTPCLTLSQSEVILVLLLCVTVLMYLLCK
jgi:hypothetical protein